MYTLYSRMSNVNRGQIYKYINQQTTDTLRTHDQYRSSILDKRHRQTVHNQTPHSMRCISRNPKGHAQSNFNGNLTTKSTMVWNTRNNPEMAINEAKLTSKWSQPYHIRRKWEFNGIAMHNIWTHWNNVTAVHNKEKHQGNSQRNLAGLWRVERKGKGDN